MTEGKPIRVMTAFALPVMVAGAVQALYSATDGVVVGRFLGVEAFAAVGLAANVHWFALSFVIGAAQGFGSVFSRLFGAGDFAGLRKALRNALVLSALLGAALTGLSVGGARALLELTRTPPELLESSLLYVRILFAAIWLALLNNAVAGALRAVGDSKTPTFAFVGSCLINIVLDVWFVWGLNWGVAGAAVATVISQAAACFVCAVKVRSVWKRLPVSDEPPTAVSGVRELTRMGFPMAFRNVVIAFGGLALQYATNGYGEVYVAGIAAAWKLYSLLEIAGGGYEGAAAVFVGQNAGAKKFERVKAGAGGARVVMLAASVVIAAVVLVFGRQLVGLFITGDGAAEAANVGYTQLVCMGLAIPFLYMLLLRRACLQGMGNAFYPTLAGFVELWARLSGAFLLPALLGAEGLYLAQIVGWPAAWLVLFLGYKKIYKKLLQNG